MKQIYKKIEAAEKARIAFESKCADVLELVLPYLDFETPESDFFHIEYQPSDGIVLADGWANVYHMQLVLLHIKKHGKIESYDDLKQLSI